MDDKVNDILGSSLPNALQLTWIAMWQSSADEMYLDSIAELGRMRGISRQAASKQVKRLVENGVAEAVGNAYKLVTDGICEEVDDRNLKVDEDNPEVDNVNESIPLSSLPFSPKKVHSTPFPPSLLSPCKVERVQPGWAPPPQWLRGSDFVRDDHPVTWDYHPGDWRWEAANYILRELWGDQRLPSRLNRRLEDGDIRPGAVASKWADTFRLLVEQDGYSRDVIRYTVQWLFQVDDWWIESGNFQSASNSALRSRDQDGTHKFDKLVQRARSHYEQQKQKRTDAAEIRRGWDEAIEEYEANRSAESTGDAIPSEPEVGGAAV